jgi:hypothetical protein
LPRSHLKDASFTPQYFQTADAAHRAGQRLRTDRTSNSVALEEIEPQSETGNYTGAPI